MADYNASARNVGEFFEAMLESVWTGTARL
jgi:hypothetical protein